MAELEEAGHHHLVIKGNILHFSLGRSLVVGAERGNFIRLPCLLLVSGDYKDVEALPKEVFLNGGYRRSRDY